MNALPDFVKKRRQRWAIGWQLLDKTRKFCTFETFICLFEAPLPNSFEFS